MAEKPANIVSIYKRFPTEESCLAHIEQVRWKGRPTCPYCTSERVTREKTGWRLHCNACNTSFSVTVNTIFHHTHMDLQKWFLAIVLMLNAKKGLSARQLGRDIEVNKNTAWYVNMRIRRAMIEGPERELLTGICEMDETYVGGKPRKGGPPQSADAARRNSRSSASSNVAGRSAPKSPSAKKDSPLSGWKRWSGKTSPSRTPRSTPTSSIPTSVCRGS
jgi:transposase-like protein